MNRGIRLCLAMLLVSGLVACTTTHETAKVRQYPEGAIVHDTTYVQQVERMARSRGVSVHWLNPPIKRMPTSSDN